jgi:hypothetical protein
LERDEMDARRDPYGWFEWYCKYDIGLRGNDDDRQIRDGKTSVEKR